MDNLTEVLSKFIEEGLGYVWLICLAVWGGTVSYYRRVKDGKVAAFSVAELVGEWMISGFAGLLTAYLCIEMELSWHMTAFFTGVAGHLGGRAIHAFEEWFHAMFKGKNDVR